MTSRDNACLLVFDSALTCNPALTLHLSLCSHAGGPGSAGLGRVLDAMPEKLHQREPFYYLPFVKPNLTLCPQAGGLGSTGRGRVLDVMPEKVHQRVPLFIGSKKEVEYLESFYKK